MLLCIVTLIHSSTLLFRLTLEVKLRIISTKTLLLLLNAVEDIISEYGEIIKLIGLHYTHELDENPSLREIWEPHELSRVSEIIIARAFTPKSPEDSLWLSACHKHFYIVRILENLPRVWWFL
ncbi:MAG: hypothetical protein DRJ37_06640 [Thermoprotei archaeon]|nr:MAG: hypothetical protein DRJ37_06640 [Thermoprotei archaeon]